MPPKRSPHSTISQLLSAGSQIEHSRDYLVPIAFLHEGDDVDMNGSVSSHLPLPSWTEINASYAASYIPDSRRLMFTTEGDETTLNLHPTSRRPYRYFHPGIDTLVDLIQGHQVHNQSDLFDEARRSIPHDLESVQAEPVRATLIEIAPTIANERQFISWTHAVCLLLGLSEEQSRVPERYKWFSLFQVQAFIDSVEQLGELMRERGLANQQTVKWWCKTVLCLSRNNNLFIWSENSRSRICGMRPLFTTAIEYLRTPSSIKLWCNVLQSVSRYWVSRQTYARETEIDRFSVRLNKLNQWIQTGVFTEVGRLVLGLDRVRQQGIVVDWLDLFGNLFDSTRLPSTVRVAQRIHDGFNRESIEVFLQMANMVTNPNAAMLWSRVLVNVTVNFDEGATREIQNQRKLLVTTPEMIDAVCHVGTLSTTTSAAEMWTHILSNLLYNCNIPNFRERFIDPRILNILIGIVPVITTVESVDYWTYAILRLIGNADARYAERLAIFRSPRMIAAINRVCANAVSESIPCRRLIDVLTDGM